MPKRYTSSNFIVKINKLTLYGDEILGNDKRAITFNQELSHIRARFVSEYDLLRKNQTVLFKIEILLLNLWMKLI